MPLLTTTLLSLVIHTQHTEYDCSLLLPDSYSISAHQGPYFIQKFAFSFTQLTSQSPSKVKIMARSFHSHWLVGLSSSVLKEEFMSSYHHGDSLVGAEPFSGRLMLPTKLQTLKLHFYLKDEAGRKNSTVTPGEITSKVTEVIQHYWSLAGFPTVSSPENKITKLLQSYQSHHKNRNLTNKKSLEDRKQFEDDLNKLLDISHPNLEKTLAEDRTLGNLVGRKAEDLSFLLDQRGERKMNLGKQDEEYRKKKEAQLKRKHGNVPRRSRARDPTTSQWSCREIHLETLT